MSTPLCRKMLYAVVTWKNTLGIAQRCRNSRPLNRSEEHTSELQSQSNLVCRLLLEKKKKITKIISYNNCNSTSLFLDDKPYALSTQPSLSSTYRLIRQFDGAMRTALRRRTRVLLL